jgi:hypothetical protein
MYMGRIDHTNPSIAANPQGFGELRYHGPRGRRFHRRARGDEIVLHIDHNHRCLGRIDLIDLHCQASYRFLVGGSHPFTDIPTMPFGWLKDVQTRLILP